MKVIRFREVLLALGGLFVCFVIMGAAQQNTSSASVSRSRALSSQPAPQSAGYSASQSGGYPSSTNYQPPLSFRIPDEIAVDEFVNYHKHRLPMPKFGQAVAMDTRWGNGEYSTGQRDAILQIGLATAEVDDRSDLRPLNLSLVIDKSGSMADDDKMARVKESFQTMVGKLRPQDIVSIVTFDTGAAVLFPSGPVGDGQALRRAIDCLQPGGSTNLNAGLMLGYAEAKKHFSSDATNRVILLTDGIANVGVTEPDRIAAASSGFNRQGVDLSTIGVGMDLNNELLRTLATAGHGLYHFVSDYQDIQKVFVNEVQSLMSSVAKRATVSIDYDQNLAVQKVYGYTPRFGTGSVSVGLDDMNSGLTQVVLLRFQAKNATNQDLSVRVRLSYFDVSRKRQVEETQVINLHPSQQSFNNLLVDPEVKKNFTIAELAQSLYDMREAVKRGSYNEGQAILDGTVGAMHQRYPSMEDKDIQFVAEIVEGFERDLAAYNRQRPNSDCGQCR